MKLLSIFRKPTTLEALPAQDAVEAAGVALLRQARQARERQIVEAAQRHFAVTQQEAASETLASFVYDEAATLISLRDRIWRKENDYYHDTRAGRKQAKARFVARFLELNRGIDPKVAERHAASQFRLARGLSSSRGRIALTDRPAYPEVVAVDAELASGDAFVAQAWQLQPRSDGLTVNYIARNVYTREQVETVEQYGVVRPTIFAEPVVMNFVAEREATDEESFFVLGVMQETRRIFEERLALRRPPDAGNFNFYSPE